MSKEKRVLTEFLELYKEFTCLWDMNQLEYNNKEARDKAYEILLEKYREIQEEASIMDVKKRIEHMRTTFRREQKKVLRSRFSGDVEEYTPKLWYYELLSFLDDIPVPSRHTRIESTPKTSGEDREEVLFRGNRSGDNPRKRTAVSAVYLSEQDNHSISISDEDECYRQDEESMVSNANQLAEAEAFGTTVGLQLKELDPLQRVFAEKLISDAIFQARLLKLNENSAIVSNYHRNVRDT